jgi:hypothetical protein
MIIDPLIPDLRDVQIVLPHALTKTREYPINTAWPLTDFYIPTEEKSSAPNMVAGLISYVNCLLPALKGKAF